VHTERHIHGALSETTSADLLPRQYSEFTSIANWMMVINTPLISRYCRYNDIVSWDKLYCVLSWRNPARL